MSITTVLVKEIFIPMDTSSTERQIKKKGRTEIDMHLSALLRNVVLLVIRNVQWALLILPTGGISKHEFVWRKK